MLELTDDLLLGKGAHKACWIDPRNSSRCIKVAYKYPDQDIKREMKYLRSRRWRGLNSALLPEFYGTVDTDHGLGYVYERIVNSDGNASLELGDWLQRERERRAAGEAPLALEPILAEFRDQWLAERIIMTNTQLENIMVQQNSANWGDVRLRIVDNIGTHVTIPLLFFWDPLARSAIKKYWHRLLHQNLNGSFPDLVDGEMVKRLEF